MVAIIVTRSVSTLKAPSRVSVTLDMYCNLMDTVANVEVDSLQPVAVSRPHTGLIDTRKTTSNVNGPLIYQIMGTP